MDDIVRCIKKQRYSRYEVSKKMGLNPNTLRRRLVNDILKVKDLIKICDIIGAKLSITVSFKDN